MADKVILVNEENGEYWWYCPGCKTDHAFWTKNKPGEGPNWSFNGNLTKPTFSPSHRVIGGSKGTICHSFVTEGQIQYLNDSNHHLAGKTVDMVDVDPNRY